MMRRKERALVIIQRASAIAAVAVVVLWVASAWWDVVWTPSPGYLVAYGSGWVCVLAEKEGITLDASPTFAVLGPGCRIPKPNHSFQWWFKRLSTPTESAVYVPLWAFLVPTLTLAAALWRRNAKAARRVKAGQCAACGYDRSGLAPEHPCPECGAATPNR